MKTNLKIFLMGLLLIAPTTQAMTALTFEEFGHGEIVGVEPGSLTPIDTIYNTAEYGFVTISAWNRTGSDLAVVFDSNQRSTEDPDLENPFENTNDTVPASLEIPDPDAYNPNNILIIQEDTSSAGPGNGCTTTECSSPDDEGSRTAGYILFEFANPIDLISLDFFDIETAAENSGIDGSEIEFLDEFGNLDTRYLHQHVPGTGGGDGNGPDSNNQNTWDRLFFGSINGIYGLRVSLAGSGAIDNLVYSVVPVPASVWLFGTALLGFIGLSRRTSI